MHNKTAQELQDMSILTVITGSKMYELDIESSDEDRKSIVKVPMNELLTLGEEWETTVYHDPDEEFHSLKKMMKLLNSQNPTVLEMLYAKPKFYTKITEEGRELIKNREIFLSQNCYNSFSGYARDQLMRIKNGLEKASNEDQNNHLAFHMEQLLQRMPERYEAIEKGRIWIDSTNVDHMGKSSVMVGLKEQIVPLSQLGGMISEMNASLRQHNKINNRNRKPEGKLQKHAVHLQRLVEEGIHVQLNGELKVSMLETREEKIAMRKGEIDWVEFFQKMDGLFADLENAKKHSVLPEKTDNTKIEGLYKKLQG